MMDKGVIVWFKRLDSNARQPTAGSDYAAGHDLYASKSCVVPPQSQMLIPTGLSIAFNRDDCYARIAPRSGLALKNFIDVGAGVVDYDYRGPVGVVLFNHSLQHFQVNTGDRIAQIIIERIARPTFMDIGDEELPSTQRGTDGFGSTGG